MRVEAHDRDVNIVDDGVLLLDVVFLIAEVCKVEVADDQRTIKIGNDLLPFFLTNPEEQFSIILAHVLRLFLNFGRRRFGAWLDIHFTF